MTSIPLHLDTPSQRPPAAATVSAPAVDAVASCTRLMTTRLKDSPVPDIVIQAENLGKHYTTGHQAEKDRDVALRAQGHALRNPARGI